MKKFLLLFILFICCKNCIAQNLIPNGDFEQFTSCPSNFSPIDSALFWMNPTISVIAGGMGGTPDYFNQCDIIGGYFSVPNNYVGFQTAHSGAGYGGLYFYADTTYDPNSREYFEVPLTSTLSLNTCYDFKMYISLANWSYYTTDAIGIYFSDTIVTGINNDYALPFTAQINNTNGYITDTLNWILISGSYTAFGSENYLIIGNFKNDLNTNAFLVNTCCEPFAYFYIDDVSLEKCDSLNNVNVLNQNTDINISPNPTDGNFTITTSITIQQIEVINLLGEKVYALRCNTPTQTLHLTTLSKGVYFIRIKTEKGMVMKKVVIE